MNASGGWRVEWQSRFRQLVACRGIWVLVLLLVLVQLAITVAGGTDRNAWVFRWFGLSREGMMSGHIWAMLSYALLHGGWLHLAANTMLLMMLGSRVEHICGWSTMLRVAGLGVLLGGAGHLASNSQWLVGGSGGVMALIFCYCGLSPESRFMMPFRVSARSLARGLLIAELCLLLLDPQLEIPGLSQVGRWMVDAGFAAVFRISHSCHLAGALVGWGYARWLLRPRVTRESLRRERARREERTD